MRASSLALATIPALSVSSSAQEAASSEHARKALEIHGTIVEIDSSKTTGQAPKVARDIADELVAAGFPSQDVEVVPRGTSRTRSPATGGTAPRALGPSCSWPSTAPSTTGASSSGSWPDRKEWDHVRLPAAPGSFTRCSRTSPRTKRMLTAITASRWSPPVSMAMYPKRKGPITDDDLPQSA
jgi:hypothetical protein